MVGAVAADFDAQRADFGQLIERVFRRVGAVPRPVVGW